MVFVGIVNPKKKEGLTCKELVVDAVLKATNTTVSVTAYFENTYNRVQEDLTWYFPLPADAYVNSFIAKTPKEVLVAKAREKEEAKEIFQQAKKEGKFTVLGKALGLGVFECSVGNIEKHTTVEVQLQYIAPADHHGDGGRFFLKNKLFPPVVPYKATHTKDYDVEWYLEREYIHYRPHRRFIPICPNYPIGPAGLEDVHVHYCRDRRIKKRCIRRRPHWRPVWIPRRPYIRYWHRPVYIEKESDKFKLGLAYPITINVHIQSQTPIKEVTPVSHPNRTLMCNPVVSGEEAVKEALKQQEGKEGEGEGEGDEEWFKVQEEQHEGEGEWYGGEGEGDAGEGALPGEKGVYNLNPNVYYERFMSFQSISGEKGLEKSFEVAYKLEDVIRPSAEIEYNPQTNSVCMEIVFNQKSKDMGEVMKSPCEFVFLCDVSGSMYGPRIKSLRETLQIFLRSLPVNAKFNIVAFNSRARPCFRDGSVSLNEKTLKTSTEFVSHLNARGGTNILDSLKQVFKSKPVEGYPRQIFLLTDGEVGNWKACVSAVEKVRRECRVHAFGIGSGASKVLCEGIAKAGRGSCLMLEDGVDSTEAIMQVVINSLQPSLINAKCNFGRWFTEFPGDKPTEQIPADVEPVVGKNTVIFGRKYFAEKSQPLVGEGCRDRLKNCYVDVEATIDNPADTQGWGVKTWKLHIPCILDNITVGNILHARCAKAKIEQYLGRNSNKNAYKKQIINEATKYNLATEFTSFVAVSELDKVVGFDSQTRLKEKKPKKIRDERFDGFAYQQKQVQQPQFRSAPGRGGKLMRKVKKKKLSKSRMSSVKPQRRMMESRKKEKVMESFSRQKKMAAPDVCLDLEEEADFAPQFGGLNSLSAIGGGAPPMVPSSSAPVMDVSFQPMSKSVNSSVQRRRQAVMSDASSESDEEDMSDGWGDEEQDKEAEEQKAENKPKALRSRDQLQSLVTHQKFNGAFTLGGEIANIFGSGIRDKLVQQLKDAGIGTFANNCDQVATICALAVLEKYYQSYAATIIAIKSKATMFLSQNGIKSVGDAVSKAVSLI